MAAAKQVKGNSEKVPAGITEQAWWMAECARAAGAAFSESEAEMLFRKWMTPRAAARVMKES